MNGYGWGCFRPRVERYTPVSRRYKCAKQGVTLVIHHPHANPPHPSPPATTPPNTHTHPHIRTNGAPFFFGGGWGWGGDGGHGGNLEGITLLVFRFNVRGGGGGSWGEP